MSRKSHTTQIYTVSKDGALFRWAYMTPPSRELRDGDIDRDNDIRWRIAQRHYFMQNNAYVNCAAFHAPSNVMVVAFSNGVFALYEVPEFTQIHSLR